MDSTKAVKQESSAGEEEGEQNGAKTQPRLLEGPHSW